MKESVASTRPQTKKEKEMMGEEIVESNGRDGLVCVKCFISFTMVLFCFVLSVLVACFYFPTSSQWKAKEKNAGKKEKRAVFRAH